MSSQRLLVGLKRILLKVKQDRPIEATQAELIIDELLLREQLPDLLMHYEAGYRILRSRTDLWSGSGRNAATLGLFESLPSRLSPESSWQNCRIQIGRLMACASAVAGDASYPEPGREDLNSMVAELLAWEVRGYRFSEQRPQEVVESQHMFTPAHLRQALRMLPGYEDADVVSFDPIFGGVSKVTILSEAVTSRHGNERFVLRGESLLPILDQVYKGMNLANEFHVLRYLHRAGAPVAEAVVLVDERRESGQGFFVSRWVEGRPPGDYLLRIDAISPLLCSQVAAALAYIHGLPVDLNDRDLSQTHLAQAPADTRESAIREFILSAHAYWQSSGAPASTLLTVAVRWLLENVPTSSRPPSIIHSDCGLNNFLVHDHKVTAIVDWETARLGDPAEDVIWLLFATSGALDAAYFMESYVRAGGLKPDPFAAKYYEVLARVRILWAQVDVQMKYERVSSANVILCAMALGQADKTVAQIDIAIREADKLKRQMGPGR